VFTTLDFPVIIDGQFTGVYRILVGNPCGGERSTGCLSMGGYIQTGCENSKVRAGKYLSDAFPVQNCLKQDAVLTLFFNFASEHTIYDSYVFNKLTSLAYTRT
jgi:hypothetical protein